MPHPKTTATPRHIVAVAGLVFNDDGDVLMVDSPKRGWELPGGQVEEGESLTEALDRELFEETGVTIRTDRLAVVHSNVSPPPKVIFGFECRYTGGTLTTSAESIAVEWVARVAVLARITHPAVARRTADLLDGRDGVRYRAYSVNPYSICSTLDFGPRRARAERLFPTE